MSPSDNAFSDGYPQLFKYMRREHADRLLREGMLRVGTLHEYRNVERHGTQVGDADEGSKGARLTVPNLVVRSAGDLPAFVRDRISIGSGTTVEMINSTFLVTEDSPNFFIFSCATEYNLEAMREMGYDACVKILDPAAFLCALSHSMRHRGNFQGLFPCVYTERYTHPDQTNDIHPALIKDPSYAQQREQRAIWQPKSPNARPVIIPCRKAARYCERMA